MGAKGMLGERTTLPCRRFRVGGGGRGGRGAGRHIIDREKSNAEGEVGVDGEEEE